MLRWIEARELARDRREAPPSLVQYRADRPFTRARWWLDLRRDLFWYFRSYCLLAFAEGKRVSAAAFALGAAAVAPRNALRLLRRRLGQREPGAV